MDALIRLTIANNIFEWQHAILTTLEAQPGKCATLLLLMSAAKLQSRVVKHPFNEALTALIEEKRVIWQDVAGQPIRVCVAEAPSA